MAKKWSRAELVQVMRSFSQYLGKKFVDQDHGKLNAAGIEFFQDHNPKIVKGEFFGGQIWGILPNTRLIRKFPNWVGPNSRRLPSDKAILRYFKSVNDLYTACMFESQGTKVRGRTIEDLKYWYLEAYRQKIRDSRSRDLSKAEVEEILVSRVVASPTMPELDQFAERKRAEGVSYAPSYSAYKNALVKQKPPMSFIDFQTKVVGVRPSRVTAANASALSPEEIFENYCARWELTKTKRILNPLPVVAADMSAGIHLSDGTRIPPISTRLINQKIPNGILGLMAMREKRFNEIIPFTTEVMMKYVRTLEGSAEVDAEMLPHYIRECLFHRKEFLSRIFLLNYTVLGNAQQAIRANMFGLSTTNKLLDSVEGGMWAVMKHTERAYGIELNFGKGLGKALPYARRDIQSGKARLEHMPKKLADSLTLG